MGGNEVSDWEDIDWQRTNETVVETLMQRNFIFKLDIKSLWDGRWNLIFDANKSHIEYKI